MSQILTSPCGCIAANDHPSGVTRSVYKCAKHRAAQRDPVTLDEAYYTELGVLRNGKRTDSAHVAELVEALGEIPDYGCQYALEIGCGISPYYRWIRGAGYYYTGIDPSPWVSDWMSDTWDAGVLACAFEDAAIDSEFGLILAAHCLEHMADAPAAIVKCASLLAPGGSLWIVVPDDSDLANPDHLWFFTEATLRSCVEAAGLVVEKTAVRKYVPHENFIYLRARKV